MKWLKDEKEREGFIKNKDKVIKERICEKYFFCSKNGKVCDINGNLQDENNDYDGCDTRPIYDYNAKRIK